MFKNKRLLILGAGRGQVGLIKTAKEMGIKTIVGTLPSQNLPGTKFADEICYMDISNPNEVLSKASTLNIDGIATSCLDTGVTSIGKVCDQLGLIGLNENAATLCFDKFKMKEALMANGVNTAKFYKISSEDELKESLHNLQLPVIIKATDLQGSKGIYIAFTEQEALEGFKKSMNDTKRDYCIIEEFIEGLEFGAQSFVYNGEVLFVMPHGDDTFMSHTAIPVGHYVPFEGSEEVIKQVEEEVRKAIKALGLDNCAVNVDLILKDNKVYIIELTGRVGANGLPELVSINYGINYYEMICAMAVGEDPKLIWEKHVSENNSGYVKMLYSEDENGILNKIEYTGGMDDNILEITFFVKLGSEIRSFKSSNDCIGQIIVKGKSIAECKEKVEKIKNRIVIDIEKV